MRILFAPQCYPPVLGGGEWHASRVAEGLAELGHDVRVVASNIKHALDRAYRGAGDAFGPPRETRGTLDVIRLRYGSGLWRFLLRSRLSPLPGRGLVRRRIRRHWQARLERRIEHELDAFQPDVVLTMAHLTRSVRAVRRIRQRRRFPLVYVPLLHVEDPLTRSPEMRAMIASADVVVSNTAFEKAYTEREFGVAPDRVVVGHLGVDPLPGEPGDGRHVLFLGRLDPQKGLGVLLLAMRRLWERGLDVPLVLAGARFHLTKHVDALLAALPPDARGRVLLREDVDEAEKDRLIREAVCLVLPSKLESFGLVLIEAWARGVPVVTWDMPLFGETVTHGEDGLLARTDDDADLARQIAAFAEDPARRLACGARGREVSRTRYRWSDVAARYAAACERARQA